MRVLLVCSLITAITIVNAIPVPRNLVNLNQLGNDFRRELSTTRKNTQDLGHEAQQAADKDTEGAVLGANDGDGLWELVNEYLQSNETPTSKRSEIFFPEENPAKSLNRRGSE